MKTSSLLLAASCLFPLAAAATVALSACGEGAVPPVVPAAPTEVPAAPPPPPPAETAAAAPSALPDAGPPPKVNSGRPMVIKSDPKEVTDTFGTSPGSKIQIGEKETAVLKIPENTLRAGTNITFRLDTKAKGMTGVIGKIYQIIPMVPPASTGSPVDSGGDPFELQLPAGTKKDANLAIGVADDKGHIKWTVVAPARIDDATSTAYFHLMVLPSGWVHVTSKPPTEKK